MKKVILAIAMVACSATSFAQHEVGSINIQPKVSFNVSSFDKLENRFDNKYKSGRPITMHPYLGCIVIGMNKILTGFERPCRKSSGELFTY